MNTTEISARAHGSARVATTTTWTSAFGSAGAILVPQCPLCATGYAAALAAMGVDAVRLTAALRVVTVSAVAISAAIVVALAIRRRDVAVLACGFTGALLVALGWLSLGRVAELAGSFIVVAAGWWNALRCASWLRALPAERNEL